MKFSLKNSIEILSATPAALTSLLDGLNDEWLVSNEGENTWSPQEVVVHLINAEKTNWIPRINVFLSELEDKNLNVFLRMIEDDFNHGLSIQEHLIKFQYTRLQSIEVLKKVAEQDLGKIAIHPVFGAVTLSQLIATWTVHDLNHLSQISRVMAHQYRKEVGPWIEYLSILNKN